MSAQDVLVLAEIQRDALADVTLELLAAARGLAAATGGQVVAVVLSQDGGRYAPSLAAADRIVLVDDPQLAAYSPEPYLAALQEVIAAETAAGGADRRHVDRLGPGPAAGRAARRPAGHRLQGDPGRRRRGCASPPRSAAAR